MAETDKPNELKAARQALGWTREHVASQLNIAIRTLQRAEQGKPVQPRTLIRIRQLLGLASTEEREG